MNKLCSAWPLALLLASPLALAEVKLLGGDALIAALQASPPCCVIDGRNALNRAKAVLPEALPYRPDLRITPTATIVVLADSDSEALRLAGLFAQQHPGKPIVAVKGGLPGWRSATAAPAGKTLGDGAPGATLQFVIPHNTCETGTPLQKLQRNKP